MLAKYQAWIKSLPPAWQTFIYAAETGVCGAVGVFALALYGALTSTQGLQGFDWHSQIKALEYGAAAACLKAFIDLLKGALPTQVPVAKS